jgi:lysozyme
MAIISEDAVKLVKEFEGLRLRSYPDENGYPTIGYGHKILPGEKFDEPITEQQASELLIQDMQSAANHVDKTCGALLTGNQFDACVSLAYNIGNGAFSSSSVLNFIKARDFAKAAESFLLWNKITVGIAKVESQGLTNRRVKEKAHFES